MIFGPDIIKDLKPESFYDFVECVKSNSNALTNKFSSIPLVLFYMWDNKSKSVAFSGMSMNSPENEMEVVAKVQQVCQMKMNFCMVVNVIGKIGDDVDVFGGDGKDVFTSITIYEEGNEKGSIYSPMKEGDACGWKPFTKEMAMAQMKKIME